MTIASIAKQIASTGEGGPGETCECFVFHSPNGSCEMSTEHSESSRGLPFHVEAICFAVAAVVIGRFSFCLSVWIIIYLNL